MNNPDLSSLEQEATNLRDQGKSQEAIENYQQLKKLFLESGDLVKAAGMQQMIGVCYKIAGDSEKAHQAFAEALEDYKKSGDKLGPGRVARDIAIAYMNDGQLDEAENYFAQSKQLLEALPSDQATAQSVDETVSRDGELGITLSKIGLLNIHRNNFDDANEMFKQAIELVRGVGHPYYESTTLSHMAALRFKQNNYNSCITDAWAALGILYEHGLSDQHQRRIAELWAGLSHCYLALGNEVTAKHFAKKSLDYINSLGEGEKRLLRRLVKADELEKLL